MEGHVSVGGCKLTASVRSHTRPQGHPIHTTNLRERALAPKRVDAVLQVLDYCRMLDANDPSVRH